MRHVAILLLAFALAATAAERINHEGRILGPLLTVTNATLFNTPDSDAIVASMQIFPTDSAWNEDISQRPPLANSDAMMFQITNALATNRQTLRAFMEMNWAIVPDTQPLVPITFTNYPTESDPGPYPISTNLPVETWPVGTGALTLDQWQANITGDGGDRHAILVQPGTGNIFETWLTVRSNTAWFASNGAKFNANSNALRPLTWTSGDAAGLCMFAGLARYDECARGMVEHAIRLVVRRTRAEFIYPATHLASVPFTTDTNVPAMGQRLRLKAGYVIPPTWSKEEKAVLSALKKYGGIVADNGGFFSISVAPDDRFTNNAFAHISSIAVTNFEVITTTPQNGGPRSPGRPTADAGPDATIGLGETASLAGNVTWTSNAPAIHWKLYSGPGAVAFASATNPVTTATFSTPGTYTLMLSASNGTHPVAYDATIITVRPVVTNVAKAAGNLNFAWGANGSSNFVVEKTTNLAPPNWAVLQTDAATNFAVPIPAGETAAFFRVRAP